LCSTGTGVGLVCAAADDSARKEADLEARRIFAR
jgi:hypothetical protein